MDTIVPHLFSGFLQCAYVTNDASKGIAVLRERYGIARCSTLDMTLNLFDGTTATLRATLAFAGDLQLELLEPRGGNDGVWRDALSRDGFSIRFHHLGFFLPTPQWEKVETVIARTGQRIALRASMQGIPFLYTDNRAELGHYMEYVHYTDDVRSILKTIPRN